MADIDTEVSALKQRAADADRAKMLAELKFQQAQQAVDEATQVLRDKYGVSSLEEAKQLIEDLKSKVVVKKEEVSSLLDKFEELK